MYPEEGPALGKPVLIMRNVTKRPETVDVSTVLLVGTDREQIVSGVDQVLLDTGVYQRCPTHIANCGDSNAAQRITDVLCGL